jgi:translation initiation factor 2 beta subunit (eIF-2beta)/eIF-5
MMPRDPTPLTVVKLSDYGGQYVLMLKCGHCGHRREAHPEVFARMAGWEAPLASVVERLRCSQCGAHQCVVTVRRQTKRDR